MNEVVDRPITLGELEARLLAREATTVLVPPRILRRVLKVTRSVTVFGQRVTRYTCEIDRATLFQLASQDELDAPPDRVLPLHLTLFARPEAGWLAQRSRVEVLRYYWRRLFHARVRMELNRRRSAGSLSDAVIRERVFRLGPAAFDEARAVLRQMNQLPESAHQADAFIEFASTYLDRRRFASSSLAQFFPGLPTGIDVEDLFVGDLNINELLEHTRLDEATDPDHGEKEDSGENDSSIRRLPEVATDPSAKNGSAADTERSTASEEIRGNTVRAAVRFWRLAEAQTGAACRLSRSQALAEIDRLAGRLREALSLSEAACQAWREALPDLLPAASARLWPVERRLLYDLQKACLDHERDLFAVDVVEWLVTFGKKKLLRPLPHQARVRMVKHLRSAAGRLPALHISDEARQQLRNLLLAALDRAEADLRARFQPLFLTALDDVGLRPESMVETVARDKVVEELLDRVIERGFLTMGDLRDAIARNRLKVPDLAGVIELLRGDRLIQANRRLALTLDGVYRRGEIYLRWLQRLSSLAFGTRLGRFLTLYFVLPLGGAFMLLEGVQHLVDPVVYLFWRVNHPNLSLAALGGAVGPLAQAVGPHPPHLLNQQSLPLTALLLFGVLYLPTCRGDVLAGLAASWRGLRFVLLDFPRSLRELPVVRSLLGSRAFLYLWRFVLKPAALAIPCVGLALLFGCPEELSAAVGSAAFAVAWVAINTRLGLQLEEVVTEAASRSWLVISADLVPGMFRLVIAFFREVLEEVERLLYAVDEWLRFHRGDGPLTLLVKPVIGLIWFAVSYVFRFCIVLLIEPQINPIKHFPVVTVSHKVMLSVGLPYLLKVVKVVWGMDEREAIPTATFIAFLIPGIFGFLAWELKENWRLYRANQAPNLQPEIVGNHGETMARLLRPGLHSGTVPKLFARLRRLGGARARNKEEALHHVAEAVRRFAERSLLAVLAGSRRWGGAKLDIRRLELTPNRIRLEIGSPTLAGDPVCLIFEEHVGWLAAGIESCSTSWLEKLSGAARQALSAALAGFYKCAGVDLVRESLADNLPRESLFAVMDCGLVVWPRPDFRDESIYQLVDAPELMPEPPHPSLTPLWSNEVLFRNQQLPWIDWTLTWERDRSAQGHEPPLIGGMVLLPAPLDQNHLAGFPANPPGPAKESSRAL